MLSDAPIGVPANSRRIRAINAVYRASAVVSEVALAPLVVGTVRRVERLEVARDLRDEPLDRGLRVPLVRIAAVGDAEQTSRRRAPGAAESPSTSSSCCAHGS